MSQTTIQQTTAIRKGSVRIKIGNDFSSLVDIGAIRDPKMKMMVEPQNIEFDNVNDLRQFAEGDKVQFSFVLAEINLTNLAKFDKGLINVTSVAGSSTPVVNEVIAVSADTAVRLSKKNGDNTRVTISAVNVEGAGASKSEGTDYEVFVDADGYTNIVKIGSGSASWEVDYSYTPATSKKITFTKFGTKELVVCRVENTDANGKVFKIDFNDVTNIEAPSIDFPADDEAEIATMPINLEGYVVEITDEQQVL